MSTSQFRTESDLVVIFIERVMVMRVICCHHTILTFITNVFHSLLYEIFCLVIVKCVDGTGDARKLLEFVCGGPELHIKI
jgi:hypothetical protein